jgi:hypothetical protein
MSDTTTTVTETTEATESTEQDQTFTQADVDRIVADRLKREREQVKSKYADYDDLKAKAGQSATLEERMAAMEKRAMDAEATALRSTIAAEFGITPEDRDLFLTASDQDTLRTQAKRLAERVADRKKTHTVPTEGKTPTATVSSDERQFVRQLFGAATAD